MSLESTGPRAGGLPKEFIKILGTVLAILLAAGLGGLLAAVVPPQHASVWLKTGAYLAPAAAMFAVYWVIAQRP